MIRQAHLEHLSYLGRRHGAVNYGQAVTPDVLVVHWSGGWRNAEAHARALQRVRDGSFHYLVDRLGQALELVRPTDAAWHAARATLPSIDVLLGEGFTSIHDAPYVDRLANLRSVSVALCNRGFLRAYEATRARARGMPVVEARHRNPSQRLSTWEGYSAEAIASFVAHLPEIKSRTPSLRVVVGHEDVRNGYVTGRGRWTAGSDFGPGPAFPWDEIPWESVGLVPARYDYQRQGWVVADG